MTLTVPDPRALRFDPGRVVTPGPPRHAAGPRRPDAGPQPDGPGAGWLTVAEAMTAPPVTVAPDAPLREVAHLVLAVGHQELVVAAGSLPLGVLTARDLAPVPAAHRGGRARRRAGDVIGPRTRRLLPGLDIVIAAAALTEDDLDAAPVVDDRGDLIGVLARRHIVAALGAQRPIIRPVGAGRRRDFPASTD